MYELKFNLVEYNSQYEFNLGLWDFENENAFGKEKMLEIHLWLGKLLVDWLKNCGWKYHMTDSLS